MVIPPFQSGYLPEGIYDCTMEEVIQKFGTNKRRSELIKKLTKYIEALKEQGFHGFIIIDGSFVTTKENPFDIDIIFAIEGELSDLASIILKKYALLNGLYQKQNYNLHLFPAFPDDNTLEGMTGLFSGTREDPNLKKGLLKVEL